MTISFEKDQDNKFDPLPEGEYQATVFSAKLEPANANGNRSINVQYRISGPTHKNRRIFERYYLTAKSLWRLKKLLVAAGTMDSGFTGSFDETAIPAQIGGKAVSLTLGTEEYGGEERNTVEAVSAAAVESDLPF